MFFSIIIPVYNSEHTLIRCLESVLKQALSDFEVIMIDDGSADSSLSICERYADQDKRFRVFHQKNRGPSSARNLGLKIAKGEYVCFVDSDDYVSANYLREIYTEIRSTAADILFFGYNSIDQNDGINDTFLPPSDLKDCDLLKELSEHNMFGYTWIKCTSRRILEGLCFQEDMFLFEDEVFTCQAVEKATLICALPKPIYYYTQGGINALTEKTHEDYCALSDKLYSAWTHMMEEGPESKDFLERKADLFVERCRYYGLERNIDTKLFFEDLADTVFFRVHTKWTPLDRQILRGNWLAVETVKKIYRIKNAIAAKL